MSKFEPQSEIFNSIFSTIHYLVMYVGGAIVLLKLFFGFFHLNIHIIAYFNNLKLY